MIVDKSTGIEIVGRHTGDVLLTVNSETLRGADLSDANLSYAYLSGADLRNANLSDANLRCADLSGADLRGANLNGANLGSAHLNGADLSGADLGWADLRGADLSGADLSDADLSGTAGNGREVSSLQLGRYHVVVAGERMVIGCQTRLITDWLAPNETHIEQVDRNDTAEWAATWRPVIEAFLTARAKGATNES